MANPGNQHCASCIGTLSFYMAERIEMAFDWEQTHNEPRIRRCTRAPPSEYERTIRARQRCGLVSNYFDRLYYDAFPQ